MKRKFLFVIKKSVACEQEKDEDEGEIENEESEDGIGKEKHPPPPKKARLSTKADGEKEGIKSDSKAGVDLTTLPSKNDVKKEPTEEEQSAETNNGWNIEQNGRPPETERVIDSGTVVDSEGCKVKKSSSVDSISSLPTPILSLNAAEVPASSYPDNHPVPVSHCVHCASAKLLSIEFHIELLAYFKHASENGAFQSLLELVPNIVVDIDDTEHLLVVKTFSSTAIEKVRMMADAFIENSRLRQKMLRQREDNSKWSFANFESNMFDANFLVEIEVSLAYTGLAFGRNRSNLAAARELYGIREITVDESQKTRGICKFKIYANSAEAAENARKMLEYTDRKMPVPSNAVGRLIGKYSRNMNDIVNKSGLVRIFMEKAITEEDKVRNFVLIGTPETIANAQMMLNFHLWHIRERDDFAEERDELERERALEKSAMVDASSLAGGLRNYDNTAFDHWTSVKAPSADNCTRVNNNNRLPRPISGRTNLRNRYTGTISANEGGNRRRNEFPMGTVPLPASSPPPLLHNGSYYQQPLAGTKGQFGKEWTDSEKTTDLKPVYRRNCPKQTHSGRWNENFQHYH